MYAQVEKTKENSFPTKRQESRAVANSVAQKKGNGKQGLGFVDHRTEAAAQRGMRKEIVDSISFQFFQTKNTKKGFQYVGKDLSFGYAHPVTQNEDTIQCMGVQQVQNNGNVMNPPAQPLIPIINRLIPVVANDTPIQGQLNHVNIELTNEGGTSPAYTRLEDNGQVYTGDIRVELNRWYLEQASVGEVLGMLAHELGVHSIADIRMGFFNLNNHPELNAENADQAQNHVWNNLPQVGPKNIGAFNPANNQEPRQRDHVNVAKGLAGGNTTRHNHYRDVYLQIGDSINNDNTIQQQERNQRLQAHTRSYLFDIARMIATDDGKALAIANNVTHISHIMNHYWNALQQQQQQQHPWIANNIYNQETGWTVTKFLMRQVWNVAKSSHPQATKVRQVSAIVGSLIVAYLIKKYTG